MSEPSNPHDALFLALRRHLLGVARRHAASAADAEDAVQDAWLRWRATDLGTVRTPEAWLLTVLRHWTIDRHRALALHDDRVARAAHDAEPAASAEDIAQQRQTVDAALRRLVQCLTPEECALVLLHEVFDTDHAETAAAWGRSEAACRQALRRALRRVRAAEMSPRRNDDATEATLLTLCLGAITTRSAAPLFALLREGAIRASIPGRTLDAASPRPAVSSCTTQLVQAGGTLAQAVVLNGVVVCVLPLVV